jgi:serine/threonine-protein kinase
MALPDPARWQRLSPWVDELLDLTEPARAERLAALRADDPTLAAEDLLAANRQADDADFLTGVADAAVGAEAPPVALEGRRFGAYTLVGPLGQGGSGAVWRARRDDGRFEGEVAVKLLHLALLGQAAARRFEREGAILARLSHPNIARLLDAGIGEGGQPYLVLELVEGERIDRHCDAKRLTIAQRLALFADALAAVAHARRHLVIHRDIKPANILVDRDGRVKLLDFGIAKLSEDEEVSEITREGGRALTPEFAAPEQLRGEPVTTATDVYALGVLLYGLLAGAHPTVSLGDPAAAAREADLAVNEARAAAQDFPSSAWLGDALAAQAAVRQAQGDRDGALAAWREAGMQLAGALGDAAPALRDVQLALGGS